MPVFRGFEDAGIVAVFDEPNSVGDIDDINAPRNAPAKSPQNYPALVYWHSGFFQYELAAAIQTISVNHGSLSGKTTQYGGSGFFTSLPAIVGVGRSNTVNRTLFTHNLGVVPLAFVAQNGVLVCPGHIVQRLSQGRTRSVSVYATNSIIGLRDVMKSSQNALPAISVSYQVLVMRSPVANPSMPLFGRDGASTVLGRNKVRTDKQYLRRVGTGDTPFVMPRGPVGDIAGGRRRVVLGNTVITEADYTGNFSGPDFITVGT